MRVKFISGYISKIAKKDIEWHENTHFGHTPLPGVCVWYNSLWYIPPASTYCFLSPSQSPSVPFITPTLAGGGGEGMHFGLSSPVCVDWRSQCDKRGAGGGAGECGDEGVISSLGDR